MSIINPNNKKMILTCDGGGIRGLIITRCLEKLEKAEGKPCNQIFHLMTGTSTGAIIAAALARGIPAQELSRLYIERGREIFRGTPNLITKFWKWKYIKDGAKEIFAQTFGDTVLNELPVDIVITAKDTVRSETMFFEKKTFGNMLLREAVESSMSAPTFFPPNGRYVDGGVGSFNNTCYQAAVEAIHYLHYPRGQITMLSFGTGREINEMKEGDAIRKNKIGWAEYAIGEGMDDANEQQVALVRREYAKKGEIDFRRYQLSFTTEVFATIGVALEKVADPKIFKMDAAQYVKTLDLVAQKFADYIDFTKSDGVELGEKPRLNESEFRQYLRISRKK